MSTQRLDKLIASRTGRSRKEARALIRAGAVLVDGAVCSQPDQRVPEGAAVVAGGMPVDTRHYTYIMLNKPAGVLCATQDRREHTVLDLVPQVLRREGLFPAGRLDKDALGLVLLTDDGALAHRLLSPRHRHPKTYRVRLDCAPDWAAAVRAVEEGIPLGGGRCSSPGTLRVLEDSPRPLAELVIYEGAFHQVKRMCAALGCEVEQLERVALGPLRLDPSLARGGCRPLEEGETALLRASLGETEQKSGQIR